MSLDLEQAFELELEEMMQQMEEENGTPELTEYDIRNFLIASKYLSKEIDDLKRMKAAVVHKWDERIKKKQDNLDYVQSTIRKFLAESKKDKLEYDVGTISTRKVPHKVKIEDELKFRIYLNEQGKLNAFLKPAELDKKEVSKYIMSSVDEAIEEEFKKRYEKQLEAEGKVTKAKEKKIYDQIKTDMVDHLKKVVPEGVEYVPQDETLQIRFND